MRLSWVALLASWTLGLPAIVGGQPPALAYEPTSAPSGLYLDGPSGQLFRYENGTGFLVPTGMSTSAACFGAAEERVMLAGVCVDVDDALTDLGPGLSAHGRVFLAGDWLVTSRLEAGGVAYPVCQPVCLTDAVPQVTYFAWDVFHAVCGPSTSGYTVPAVASILAVQTAGGASLLAREATDIACPAAMVICHYPPANPAGRRDILVDLSAWPSHREEHGDTTGSCPL